MKKQLLHPLFSIFFLLTSSTKLFSQNANIVYSTATGLCNIVTNPSCCNVFNMSSNTVVGGFRHLPLAGGANFDGTGIGMMTTYNPGNNTDNGCGYAIEYPFKYGYNYVVKITMSYKPMIWAPSVKVGLFSSSLPNPSLTNPTACGPVGYSNYVSAFGFLQGNFLAHTPSSTEYTVPQFSVPSAYNFMSIVVNAGYTSGTSIKITKVTITETPRFTLTPNNTAKVCGTSVAQTFSVNNLGNAPGVTSYSWNLGATPNGWTYLGSPAPASIVTTGNSINLTANACEIPSSVSATANTATLSYQTNVSTISPTNPMLTITGSSSLCSGSQQYSVDNIPCGGTVSWSVSLSGPATMTTSGNQATLNYVSSGNIILYANVSLPCAVGSINLVKEIVVGIPIADNFPIFGPSLLCTNQIGFYSTPVYGGVTYNWTVTGFPGGGAGPSFTLMAPPFPGSGQIILNLSNACGNVPDPPIMFVNINNCFKSFVVTPNPATDNLSINATNDKKTVTPDDKEGKQQGLIYAIKVFDNSGNTKIERQYRLGQTSVNLQVTSLNSGIYLISIFNGKSWESQQIVVQ